ncbi:MAG: acyclic terpene utilization AtuA family protein [Pseudomonadota bacterium]
MSTATPDRSAPPVRIGGACAFVGDSVLGPRQLADVPGMQYLVFDYLAEMTMSAFVQARRGNAALGYATDFVDVALRELLPRCAQRGIKLVANAGGLNPRACAQACEALLREMNCEMRVAFVEGDDCLGLLAGGSAGDVRDFYSGESMPAGIDSANAYLGALPIAKALDLGADIVITGRIVDSATTLGVLIHSFGWSATDYDLLAAGSLAGHLLECGPQATGGTHTDWRDVPGWENIGYPFIDFQADGSFAVGKPAGTGGLLNVATVSEQALYEVGDPANYLLPDVTCDFSAISITQAGDRVLVSGARGHAPGPDYKVSATWQDGYRCVAQVAVFGIDALAKARRTGEALLNRVRAMLLHEGLPDFEKTAVSVIGAEDGYGPRAHRHMLREAIARVAVTHTMSKALDIFSRESRAAGVSWAPGTTAGSALTLNSRPPVEPRYRLFACLLPKAMLQAPTVVMEGRSATVDVPVAAEVSGKRALAPPQAATATSPLPSGGPLVEVPLIRVAYARCGDKGNNSNIAVFAREPRFLPYIEASLQDSDVQAWFAHLIHGRVEHYRIPTLNAVNFMLYEALDGGGPTSLRTDPLGKGMAQMILEMPVRVPAGWAG